MNHDWPVRRRSGCQRRPGRATGCPDAAPPACRLRGAGADIDTILDRAVAGREHGFGGEAIELCPEARAFLVRSSDGDARQALGALEVGVLSITERPLEFTLELAQAVTYLAIAPKSNACTTAIAAARHDVREQAVIPVPRHLQDKHYANAKRLGHGQGYTSAHDHPDGIAAQDYLGGEKTYYEPTDRGLERALGERLAEIRRPLRERRPDREQTPPSAGS